MSSLEEGLLIFWNIKLILYFGCGGTNSQFSILEFYAYMTCWLQLNKMVEKFIKFDVHFGFQKGMPFAFNNIWKGSQVSNQSFF
jgi:hypothetical protein